MFEGVKVRFDDLNDREDKRLRYSHSDDLNKFQNQNVSVRCARSWSLLKHKK